MTLTPTPTRCGLVVCGDGIVKGNEQCDDGAQNGDVGKCSISCTWGPAPPPPPPPPGTPPPPPPPPSGVHVCSQQCDHRGYCIEGDKCEGCAEGWTGQYCGTLADAGGRLAALVVGLTGWGLLALAVLVLVWHKEWRPIRARGIFSACLGMFCGGVWLYIALATLRGEDMQYNAGNAGLWGWWVLFLPGFGGWLAVQVLHLRFLVQIHVFEKIPAALWFK